jgi:hypothetical protein
VGKAGDAVLETSNLFQLGWVHAGLLVTSEEFTAEAWLGEKKGTSQDDDPTDEQTSIYSLQPSRYLLKLTR